MTFDEIKQIALKGKKQAMSNNFIPFGFNCHYQIFDYVVCATESSAIERALINNYNQESGFNPSVEFVEHSRVWTIGQTAYCPSRNIQQGHNAKIREFRVSESGQVWARLDFQIINKMSAWVRIEELS